MVGIIPASAVLIIVDAARWGQRESVIGVDEREAAYLQLYAGDVVVIGFARCRPFAKLLPIGKNSS